MDRRRVSVVLAVIVAASLVGAPATMSDWGEQATFSAEQIDESQIRDRTPVIRYENLSTSAQNAVRHTIESPDHDHVVYGQEDWPDRFFYSDNVDPGQGMYVIVYEGQYYRITTYAGGGFPFVYWLYELPFVVYGFGLAAVALQTDAGKRSPRTAVLAAVPGIAFHLLGPEFDFPLLAPTAFVGFGILATAVLGAGLIWQSVTDTDT